MVTNYPPIWLIVRVWGNTPCFNSWPTGLFNIAFSNKFTNSWCVLPFRNVLPFRKVSLKFISLSESKHIRIRPSEVRRIRLQSLQYGLLMGLMKPTVPSAPAKRYRRASPSNSPSLRANKGPSSRSIRSLTSALDGSYFFINDSMGGMYLVEAKTG